MKKSLILLSIIVTVLTISTVDITRAQNEPNYYKLSEVVLLRGNNFYLNGELFYPIIDNYSVDIVGPQNWKDDLSQLYLSKAHGCGEYSWYECNNLVDCRQLIIDDLIKLSENGINTIRLPFGCTVMKNTEGTNSNCIYAKQVYLTQTADTNGFLFLDENPENAASRAKYFELLDDFVSCAKEVGLKVIIMVSDGPGNKNGAPCIRWTDHIEFVNRFLTTLAEKFKYNTAVMAYDIYNEPKWFDRHNFDKDSTCIISNNWNEAIKSNSIFQLTTIGLFNQTEVAEWDPHGMDVDFLSFHPYAYSVLHDSAKIDKCSDVVYFHPQMEMTRYIQDFKRAIYWYNRAIKKPWIIGETSVSGDDILETICHGNQEEQYLYATKTLKYCDSCGGSGYSWWGFQDNDHNNQQRDDKFYGLFDIHGNPKKVLGAFYEFSPNPIRLCNIPKDYYTHPYYTNDLLSVFNGHFYDEDNPNEAIPNGVVESYYYKSDNNCGDSYKHWSVWPISASSDLERDLGYFEIKTEIFDPQYNPNGLMLKWASGLGYECQVLDMEAVSPINIYLRRLAQIDDFISITNETYLQDDPHVQAWNNIEVSNISIDQNEDYSVKAGKSIALRNFRVARGGRFNAKTGDISFECEDLVTPPEEKSGEITGIKQLLVDKQIEDVIEEISIIPNPSSGVFYLETNLIVTGIQIFDLFGKEIYHDMSEAPSKTLDLSEKSIGIYILSVRTQNEILNFKIIRN